MAANSPDANTVVRVNLSTVLESVKGYYDMTPAEFNLLSEIGTEDAESIHFEWDEFVRQGARHGAGDGTDATAAHVDGRTFNAQRLKFPSRRGNFAQILGYDISVSRRANKAKKGGVLPEINRQILVKGYDLNEAIETILLGWQAAEFGRGQPETFGDPSQAAQDPIAVANANAERPDKTASIANFILTNTDFGVGGGAASLSDQGVPTGAPNPGVKRALSWATLHKMLREMYRRSRDNGMIIAWTDLELFDKVNEALIVSQGGRAAGNLPVSSIEHTISEKGEATAIGSIPYYKAPREQLVKFMSNRYMPLHKAQAAAGAEALEATASASKLILMNPSTWKVCYIDRLMRTKMGRDGDRYRTQLTVDFGLKSTFEAANALISDLDPEAAVAA